MLRHVGMIDIPLPSHIVYKTIMLEKMSAKRKLRVFPKYSYFRSSNHHPPFLRAFIPEIRVVHILADIPAAALALL